MSTNTDYVGALPTTGSADKAALRSALVKRTAYVMADSDTPTDLVAVDPSTGASIVDIMLKGRTFHYDSTDTTTANDGITCLVSNEGRRYKLSDQSDVFCYAVLDNTISVPPVSPSIGDKYLVAAGATGAWASQDGNVAAFTSRGWEFIEFGIGRLVYVESVDSYLHKTTGGSWALGFGNQALSANSVPITAVIGAEASFVIKVENQTTNAPPGLPTVPTAYVIGPSPTGAWSGHAGALAICLVAGTFTIISPVNGDQVYDKSKNSLFTFNGTSWGAAAGAFINTTSTPYTANTALITAIPFDNTIPQISEGTQILSVSYTMKSTTNKLRIRFTGMFAHNTATSNGVIAFFQDSIANAIKATATYFKDAATAVNVAFEHEYVPATTSPITISVRAGPAGSGQVSFNGNGSGALFGGVSTALLVLEEIPA